MLRARVTGKGFRRVERDGQGKRRVVMYERGAELTVSHSFYEACRDRLTVIADEFERPVESAGTGESMQAVAQDAEIHGDGPGIDQLRAEAADLGVNVNARWKERRLKAEIDKAAAAE